MRLWDDSKLLRLSRSFPLGLVHQRGVGFAQLRCVEAIAAAQGTEQCLGLRFGPIALGEGVKHGAEPNAEKLVGFKPTLMAQQMQLHQQLISKAAVQRRNDVGKGLMKRAFAVGDGLTCGQRAVQE